SAAALAATAEADVSDAVLDAIQRDVAAVARHTGVDVDVQHVLHLLRDGVVPLRAGEEDLETRLHDTVHEVDRGTVERLGAERVQVDLERALVLHVIVLLLVRRLLEPEPLLGTRAGDPERANVLRGLRLHELEYALFREVCEGQHDATTLPARESPPGCRMFPRGRRLRG